jgi:putative beta-lysine N-acetyltransferase
VVQQMMHQINNGLVGKTLTNDIIEYIGNSMIQHGIYNDRIYLMKLSIEDFPNIIDKLNKMASENGYSKIFAKIPLFARDKFIANDYILEASIPISKNDKEDRIYFMGKYFDKSRMTDNNFEDIDAILGFIMSKENILGNDYTKLGIPRELKCEMCKESHISQMANLYRKVFCTYPFPIYDPKYIRKTMNENIVYFSIMKDDKIVALSSSEMDTDLQHVEMTDFATLPEYQGRGFALYLLHNMEEEMRKRNMRVAYTISRAVSYGINMVFAKMGYIYGGTLTNNTNISTIGTSSDNFESMNVWYKSL